MLTSSLLPITILLLFHALLKAKSNLLQSAVNSSAQSTLFSSCSNSLQESACSSALSPWVLSAQQKTLPSSELLSVWPASNCGHFQFLLTYITFHIRAFCHQARFQLVILLADRQSATLHTDRMQLYYKLRACLLFACCMSQKVVCPALYTDACNWHAHTQLSVLPPKCMYNSPSVKHPVIRIRFLVFLTN